MTPGEYRRAQRRQKKLEARGLTEEEGDEKIGEELLHNVQIEAAKESKDDSTESK